MPMHQIASVDEVDRTGKKYLREYKQKRAALKPRNKTVSSTKQTDKEAVVCTYCKIPGREGELFQMTSQGAANNTTYIYGIFSYGCGGIRQGGNHRCVDDCTRSVYE